MTRPVALFYLVTVLGNLDRSLAIVVMAWVTLVVTDDLASVGMIFVIGHVLNVVLGPGIGAVIDRYPRRHCVIVGQSVMAAAAFLPVVLAMAEYPLGIETLVVVAVVMALGNLLNSGALDGLLQQITRHEDRPHASAVAAGLRQGAMIAGAGGGGFLIDLVGATGSFLVLTLSSVLVAVGVFFLPPPAARKASIAGYRAYAAEIREGFTYFLRVRGVASLAVVTALAFSAGHLTNVLLPALVRNEAGGGSTLYGIIDAAWSVGGITAAFAVSVYVRHHAAHHGETIFLVVLGLSLALLAFVSVPSTLIMVHLVMGAAFSISKALCDGLLLQICHEDMIGRVRTNINILTSAIGTVIYLSPAIVETANVRVLYFGWGSVIVVAGIAILFSSGWLRQRQRPD